MRRIKGLLAALALLALFPVSVAVQSGWVTQNNAQQYITRNANNAYAVTITQQNTSACTLKLVSGATTAFAVCGTTVTVASAFTLTGVGTITFSGGQSVVGATANVTELYNSTTAQQAYVYNTRTSATVYERLGIGFLTSNTAYIRTEGLGGGTQRTLRVDGNPVQLLSAGTIIGKTSSAGWEPGATNTQDLGASGNTWRTGYFGTSVVSPVYQTTTALITATGASTASFLTNGVGGTGGPTTAAQNGWMKFQDSTGATVWIPVWK